ncbi:hypothetical protein B0H10DRAFT_2145211 [Mycena sp. CBHHK59/15]|nr:hypothetical protein B0H10DRAFT_2145211 [Mycena sp. CBHHK59/15]
MFKATRTKNPARSRTHLAHPLPSSGQPLILKMTWDRSSTLTSWRPIWLQASSHWWRPHNLEFQRPLLLRRTRRTSLQRGSPHLLGISSRLPIKVSHCPMRMQEAHRAMFTTSPASVWKYAQRRFHGLWFIVQRNWRCFSLIYQAHRFKNSCRPDAHETWAPAGFLFDCSGVFPLMHHHAYSRLHPSSLLSLCSPAKTELPSILALRQRRPLPGQHSDLSMRTGLLRNFVISMAWPLQWEFM